MAEKFSLKDHLFNAESIADLAAEFAAGVPGFDAKAFHADVMAGLGERELLARLDWIADCLEPRLEADFPKMADQLQAAMPPELNPALRDDDFGRFIHAVPGILAVRHGLENHRDRALNLLHAATRRFSMEFYIRPFLNRWPEETLARLALWAEDDNYHVRRLVSEGTRPRLPWAGKVMIDPLAPLPLLDGLHADPTRYVTRSVANHLNDIAKFSPDVVLKRLAKWQEQADQSPQELAWMTRHALRTLLKDGHEGALIMLGYDPAIDVVANLSLGADQLHIGDALDITCEVQTNQPCKVMVDYVLQFHRPGGKTGRKVFKLKQGQTTADEPLILKKKHPMKGNATTFTLHPGPHRIDVQVNGRIITGIGFELRA